MQQILVYGDSLTWGIVPGTRRRLPFDGRWPGVMEGALTGQGHRVRVVEDCLNGRRTTWDDPFKPGRRGLERLEQRIEAQSPLALVILMLGTNDFQATHRNTPALSAQGVAALVRAVRQAPIEPGMPVPPVLVVAPPPMDRPRGTIAAKFEGAEKRSAGAAAAYRDVAVELGCAFFDAGTVTASSTVDGVHLDAEQHHALGLALAATVGSLLSDSGLPRPIR
jgi:lysophospholipase L1-like esterase